MKTKGWLMGFSIMLLCLISCEGRGEVRHYELQGGVPEVDYIDFLNDSLCRYVAPGPLTLTSKYIKDGDAYIIYINNQIKARLIVADEKTLLGEAPFFEGVWVMTE